MNGGNFFLDPLKHSGRPRYIPAPPSFSMFRSSAVSYHMTGSMSAPKVIDDFLKFISCPEATPYKRRHLKKFEHTISDARQRKKLSSAKRRCWTKGQRLESFIPMISPIDSALFMTYTKTSHNMNKSQIQRSGTIWPKTCPFIMTE